MWGSLQLDWPFSLVVVVVVVVVITITSRSHRSPSTDDCKYSTPVCVSVCSSTVVWFSSVCGCDFPLLMLNITPVPPHSLTSQNCPISPIFRLLLPSSLTLSLVWEDRSMVHCWLVPIGSLNSSLPFSLHEHSPQTGSGIPVLRLVLPCLASGGVTLISWWLGLWCPAQPSLPSPPPPSHPLQLSLTVPLSALPTAGLLLASDLFEPCSLLSVGCATSCCMSVQTCPVGLSRFMFSCHFDGVLLWHRKSSLVWIDNYDWGCI